MELKIRDLSKSYGTKSALEGFTYTFYPGVTAILGPNGAGKTTLMNLITDCVRRQTGEIRYNGTDILKLGKTFRQKLGFMPQSQGMYEQMTAYDFLCYMAELKGLNKKTAILQIRELLSVVHLESATHQRLGGFSAGALTPLPRCLFTSASELVSGSIWCSVCWPCALRQASSC